MILLLLFLSTADCATFLEMIKLKRLTKRLLDALLNKKLDEFMVFGLFSLNPAGKRFACFNMGIKPLIFFFF